VCLEHQAGPGHPERPARVTCALQGIEEAGLGDDVAFDQPRPATDDELARVHDRDYIDGIRRFCEGGGGWLTLDTGAGPRSWDAALAAAGAPLDARSRFVEGFRLASIVFCVGPLTILGSLDNGLRGDVSLLAIKSLLDGVASIAFAAALGAGVYLSVLTIVLVQGSISAAAFLLRDVFDARTALVVTSAARIALLGVALRLLDLKAVRVANFLPGVVLAPVFLRIADAIGTLL